MFISSEYIEYLGKDGGIFKVRHKTLTRLPKIRAQYFVPVGRECRPAYWLLYMGLRDGALSFDWMIISGFDLIVRTLKQGCRFWFNTYKEWPSNEDIHRIVVDETINLRSLHHFPKDEYHEKVIREHNSNHGEHKDA